MLRAMEDSSGYDEFFLHSDLQEKVQLTERLTALEKLRQDQELAFLEKKYAALERISEVLDSNKKRASVGDAVPKIENIYAVQWQRSPSLYRVGSIEIMHNFQSQELHTVTMVAPTLDFWRDLKKFQNHFRANQKNDGFYLVDEIEVRFFFNTIISDFNRNINQLYKEGKDIGIPPPEVNNQV